MEARRRRPGRGAQPDSQHPAGHADCGLRAAARLEARRAGLDPALWLGTASGEYTALVAAGALICAMRCRWCAARASDAGGGAGGHRRDGRHPRAGRRRGIRAVCAEAAQGQVLEAANFNAPSQVVIAGHRAAVERGMELAKAKGAKRARDAADERAVSLQPDAGRPPSDCASGLQASLCTPRDSRPQQRRRGVLPTDPREIRTALVRQLTARCAGLKCVQEMARRGVDPGHRMRPRRGAHRPEATHRDGARRRSRSRTRGTARSELARGELQDVRTA